MKNDQQQDEAIDLTTGIFNAPQWFTYEETGLDASLDHTIQIPSDDDPSNVIELDMPNPKTPELGDPHRRDNNSTAIMWGLLVLALVIILFAFGFGLILSQSSISQIALLPAEKIQAITQISNSQSSQFSTVLAGLMTILGTAVGYFLKRDK